MNSFSELTLQNISKDGRFYVYGLIDPRTDKIFYIGKGTGNRVFQHVEEAGKNPESEKLKLQTIQSIESSGMEVKHILINWGLSEEEAFVAEASLINLMNYITGNGLSNIVAGHHTDGCMSVEEVERIYGAEQLELSDIHHKVLVIKVNKLYNRGMPMDEIYDVVRGIWRANLKHIEETEYVIGVYNNLIIGCFKPSAWHIVGEVDKSMLPKHMQVRDYSDEEAKRVFFVSDDINNLDENQSYYLNKSIEKIEFVQKSQYPIAYIGY